MFFVFFVFYIFFWFSRGFFDCCMFDFQGSWEIVFLGVFGFSGFLFHCFSDANEAVTNARLQKVDLAGGGSSKYLLTTCFGYDFGAFSHLLTRCFGSLKNVAERLYANHLQQIYKHFERKLISTEIAAELGTV